MEWQKGLSWEQQFELLGADGIDFHSIITTPPNCEIIDSFTKEEFLKGVAYPRTGYTFWKNIEGHKFYLCTAPTINVKKPHKVFVSANVEYVMGHLRYGHYEGEIEIPDIEWDAFQANPKQWLKDNDGIDNLDLLIDDWSVDGVGDIDEVQWRNA